MVDMPTGGKVSNSDVHRIPKGDHMIFGKKNLKPRIVSFLDLFSHKNILWEIVSHKVHMVHRDTTANTNAGLGNLIAFHIILHRNDRATISPVLDLLIFHKNSDTW